MSIAIAWQGSRELHTGGPGRFVTRHTGTFASNTASGQKSIGKFGVVVIDGLAALLCDVSLRDVCDVTGLPPLWQLADNDGAGWLPRIEQNLLPDTSWIRNMIFVERLEISRAQRAAVPVVRLIAAVVGCFGTGCSLACCWFRSFDTDKTASISEREAYQTNALYQLHLAGWRRIAGPEFWINDVVQLSSAAN